MSIKVYMDEITIINAQCFLPEKQAQPRLNVTKSNDLEKG